MKSSSRARLGKLGPVRDVTVCQSSFGADLRLRKKTREVNTPIAALTLAKRGVTLARAKRALDVLSSKPDVTVHVPAIDNITALINELTHCGVSASLISNLSPDVRAIRDKLNMTQEEFALAFNIDVAVIRNWEQSRHLPDRTAQCYLRVLRQ